ncbi:MAG: class I SAM-dependent methyltransferase, partial [Dokdonella sp.]|nr:class I SAM-dependent methyltransferase [Dokdonella sp.]
MSDSQPLPFTGERFTPECVREIWYEHWHRYAFARGLVAGKRVLDAACGEGYGSALLAAVAGSVTGVDVDADAIAHARARYGAR